MELGVTTRFLYICGFNCPSYYRSKLVEGLTVRGRLGVLRRHPRLSHPIGYSMPCSVWIGSAL
jgi:hypothetical protein